MSVMEKVRSAPFVVAAVRGARNLIHGRGWGAFHGDRIYSQLMLDLLQAFPITSFIETGTFRGYSTELIAWKHPNLPVFTAEVYEPSYKLATAALRKYRNITAELGSSDELVRSFLDRKLLGNFPLFYLDAHWQTYWPLRAEMGHIGNARLRAIMVIDDFEVPGQPQFGYDVYGDTPDLRCDLNYILPAVMPGNTYHAAFPKYSSQDSFGKPSSNNLRGHIVLFQNAAQEYEQFLSRPLARDHYSPYGELRPGPQSTGAGA